MKKICGALLIGFVVLGLKAQNTSLPGDFRQQNLTEYNASLLNPAYSFDRNNPSSIAFWARWQWQAYDADPTSLFLNYTTKLNEVSAAGVGFFQHNTGIFLNTGAALNYAYNIELSEKVFLGVGLNFFAFQQKLADQRFFIPNPIQTTVPNDFVVQLAPGINLNIDRFNIGLTSENLFDYNFTTNERNSSPDERLFLALASYDFPLAILDNTSNSILRPSLYYKSIPGLDSQFGFTSLLTTDTFWVQGGYNSFYGFSGGVGGRFFKRFSIGALLEVGTSPDVEGQDPSFELVTSYKLGKLKPAEDQLKEELIAQKERQQELIVSEELTKVEETALKREAKKERRLAKIEANRVKDSTEKALNATKIAAKPSNRDLRRKRDSIENARAEQALADSRSLQLQRKQDSIASALQAAEEARAMTQLRRRDSIAQSEAALLEAQRNEVVTPKAGEKYEEVSKEGSLSPGYYLIANVFGTKKYFEVFMAEMKKKGLNPKSFFREANNYNYVYLGKYNSINEARTARDSKLDGKYTEKLWIFRVTGE